MSSGKIKKFIEGNEKIIFSKVQSIYMQDVLLQVREYMDTEIYISDFANIYLYNEKSNFVYYLKQSNSTKSFRYDADGDKVVIHFKKTRFKSSQKSALASFADFNIEVEMTKEEFNEVKAKLQVPLFKEKEQKKKVDDSIILQGEGIYKFYGSNKEKFLALKGISIDIHKGDFVCIMGPSGSGKSTLINVLSSIDNPSKGHVKFNGKNIWEMSETEIGRFRYENLGFIFQDFNLVNNLSIKENIAMPLVLASKSREEIEEKINKIAEKLDIKEILAKFPAECSGGQMQRAACARALVSEPKVIVADEPTGNLDTKNSHELLKMMVNLNEEGITIVMVTHDNMIASYSQKILFIRDGKIDNLLERDNLSQKEYFYKIVDITSKESQGLMDIL